MTGQNPNKQPEIIVLITLSPEVKKLLDDNEVQLTRLLNQRGIAATRCAVPPNAPSPEPGLKSPELALLVSAVSIPMVASGIARILDSIGRNQKVVAIARSWKPIIKDGKPIVDPDGKPLMTWEETPTLLEAKQTEQERLQVETSFLGLHFKMK